MVLKLEPDYLSQRLMMGFRHDERSNAIERQVTSSGSTGRALLCPGIVILFHVVGELSVSRLGSCGKSVMPSVWARSWSGLNA